LRAGAPIFLLETTEDFSMTMSMTLSEPKSGAVSTFFKAIVSGCVIAVVGLGIWGALLMTSLKTPAFTPWLMPAMGGVLLVGAAYLKWGKFPRSGAAFRREGVRLNKVGLKPFLFSLAAGWSTMLTGFCLYVAHRTVGGMGGEAALLLPHAPLATLLPGLIMAAITAGTVEEIAFRGFMQGTLERRFGLVPAILVSGFVWALFHTNHSYFGEEALVWFGIFLSVAAMLGTVASRTNSLIPGIAIHSGFDAAYFIAAGLLAAHNIAPIAWLQSFANPQELVIAAGLFGVVMLISWVAFFRATRAA
jgi:membrane protease YdiL (CAAX protease family)